jgi:predicted enzyme related to lactoylglutathione lyase
VLRLGVLALGATDVERAAAFWGAALGYRLREGVLGGWGTVLSSVDGSGISIALQRSESEPEARPRLHLDLHVADAAEQEAEVARLVGLGAQRVDWDSYPDEPDFVVLADTEGNLFCIVDVSLSATE